jgi:hemerythrin superfamily protein
MAVKRKSARARSGNDAVEMLTSDHKEVKALFKEFAALKKQTADSEEKTLLVRKICNELTVHAQIEEEIFYPAVRKAIDDGDLMDEALVEHAGAKELISQLEAMDPEDELYDAKVTVLGEQIDHHVKEEEGEMFPKARRAKVDLEALGTQMAERKAELREDLALIEERGANSPHRSGQKKSPSREAKSH